MSVQTKSRKHADAEVSSASGQKNTVTIGQNGPPISRTLAYSEPYDWESILAHIRWHQLPNLETVDLRGYERVVQTSQGIGWFTVTHDKATRKVRLSMWNGNEEDFVGISAAVRRMFDLDAEPNVIREAMSADPYLLSLWNRHPGLRIARRWSGFEALFTTVLGQLVSLRFARTLADEFMKAAGTKVRHPKTSRHIYLFPTVHQILNADLSAVRTSESRRTAIRSLAALVADGTLNWRQSNPPAALRKTLLSVPGVGPWTAEYVAMHGFDDNDAFPATDYVLKQELKRHPEVDVKRVRPWRAYAVMALWKGFTFARNTKYEPVV